MVAGGMDLKVERVDCCNLCALINCRYTSLLRIGHKQISTVYLGTLAVAYPKYQI